MKGIWKKASMLLAMVFLLTNMVAVVPALAEEPAPSAVWADRALSGFDSDDTARILNNLYPYKGGESTFKIGAEGTGRNGTKAGVLNITANKTGSDEHRIQSKNELVINVKQGHTYHVSFWAKADRDEMQLGINSWFKGYHVNFTNELTSTSSTESGLYTTTGVPNGQWKRFEMCITINKVTRKDSNGSNNFYELEPNPDGTYTNCTAAYDTATGQWTVTPGTGLVQMDFFSKVLRGGKADGWPDDVFPANIYVDDWYILDEAGPDAVTTSVPLIYDATVTNSSSASGVVSAGDILTVRADVANANLAATTETGYKWQRSTDEGVNWQDITGETGETYTASTNDEGARLRAVVTAQSAIDSGDVKRAELATDAVRVLDSSEIPDVPPSAVWADPALAGFDAEDTARILNNFHAYKKDESTFSIGEAGTGRNGTKAGVLTMTKNKTGSDEFRLQSRNELLLNMRQGHTYHISFWTKTDRDEMQIGLNSYFKGYHVDFTDAKTGNKSSKQSGIYATTSVTKGEWKRFELALTINEVYKKASNDGNQYYKMVPNADGTYTGGTVVYNAGGATEEEKFTWTPDAKGALVQLDFFGKVLRGGKADGWPDDVFPVNVYVDDWYILDEAGPAAVTSSIPLVYDATLTNSGASQTEAATGDLFTASAAVANANLMAQTATSYGWQRSTDGGETWQDIAGETGETYTAAAEDGGALVRAVVTASSPNDYGQTKRLSVPTNEIQVWAADPVKPVIRSISIAGVALSGQELSAAAEAFDANGDELDPITWQWQSAAGADDEWSDISGATSDKYTVTDADTGKYIRVLATAHSKADPKDGDPAPSNVVGPVLNEKNAPTAINVAISGVAKADSVLTAGYTYEQAEDGEAEGESIIAWESSDTADDAGFAPIEGAVGRTFTIPASLAGKFVRIRVTPVDKNGFAGKSVVSAPVQVTNTISVYVATDGSDSNPGTIDQPFASLEAARDYLRANKPAGAAATVYVRGGVYQLSKTFSLGQQDSGTEDAPVIYRAYGDEKVTLSGGLMIDYNKFSPISDAAMKAKLKSTEAQGKVVVADLDEIGLGDFAKIPIKDNNSTIAVPLFVFDGKALKLSKWPNSNVRPDWPTVDTVNRGECTRYPAGDANQGTGLMKVKFSDDTPTTWTHNIDDIIYMGYYRFDWYAEAFYPTINKEEKTLEAKGPMYYGADGTDSPFQAYNIFEEIDEPGEWYIDRSAKKMYFYPYETTQANPSFKMSQAEFDLVSLQNTSYVTFRDIEVTAGRKKAIIVNGGTGNVIDGCDINTFEGKAVDILGGSNNGIKNSRVYETGTGAITINGGDKTTITPANNYVSNNIIYDFSLLKETYAAAVSLNGVGNKVDHNEVYNAAHQAMTFNGVDNVIEYNVIHDVCLNAADMGAIYSGRNLADHGNIIRYNHFYNIGNPVISQFSPCAIFTDDGSCDMQAYGNVFGTGVLSCEVNKVHGGQNNSFTNNLYIDAPNILYVADWTDSKWKLETVGENGQFGALKQSFDTIKDNPLYLERWPWLRDVTAKYMPNTLENNVMLYINAKRPHDWVRFWAKDNHIIAGRDNNMFVEDKSAASYLKDFANGNYALTDEAYAKIRETLPEFEEIPFEAMGPVGVVNHTPQANDVTISGEATLGGVLTGSYTYFDNELEEEGNTTFRWLVSDTPDGRYEPITGATTSALTINESLSGRFVKFEVTPRTYAGAAGSPALSDAKPVILDKSSLEKLLGQMNAVADSAVAGAALGNYPQAAITAFRAEIATAQGIYDKEEATLEECADAAADLTEAYEVFAAQRVRSASADGNSVYVPADLQGAVIDAGEIAGGFTLTTDGGVLPAVTVNARINGKPVVLTIPDGTTAPDGSLLVVKNIGEPSGKLFGYTAIAVELAGGVSITVSDVAGCDAMWKNGSDYQSIAKATSGGTVGWTAATAGEYVVAELYTPSNSALLSELKVGSKRITLKNGKFDYTYTLPYDATSAPEVTATAADPKASLEIQQAESTTATATIKVVAEDGVASNTYTVRFVLGDAPAPTPDYNGGGNNGGNGNYGGGSGTGSYGSGSSLLGGGTKFTDIAGHWAKADIEVMAAKGIVTGVTDTTFEPDRNITRAEFATLVSKALNLNSLENPGFSDVAAGDWYYPFVCAAANAGLIAGYDGSFRPDDLITREEMAVIIAKAYQFRGGAVVKGGLDKFADKNEISDWAWDSVDLVTSAGLVSGMTPTTFVAKANATRAQTASLLRRLLAL